MARRLRRGRCCRWFGFPCTGPPEGAAWSWLHPEACGTSERSERLTRVPFPTPLRVAVLLADSPSMNSGYSGQEGRAPSSVRTHVKGLHRKLGASRRLDLIRLVLPVPERVGLPDRPGRPCRIIRHPISRQRRRHLSRSSASIFLFYPVWGFSCYLLPCPPGAAGTGAGRAPRPPRSALPDHQAPDFKSPATAPTHRLNSTLLPRLRVFPSIRFRERVCVPCLVATRASSIVRLRWRKNGSLQATIRR